MILEAVSPREFTLVAGNLPETGFWLSNPDDSGRLEPGTMIAHSMIALVSHVVTVVTSICDAGHSQLCGAALNCAVV